MRKLIEDLERLDEGAASSKIREMIGKLKDMEGHMKEVKDPQTARLLLSKLGNMINNVNDVVMLMKVHPQSVKELWPGAKIIDIAADKFYQWARDIVQ